MGGFDGKALVLQKQYMGREAFDLVVHPENALRASHVRKVSTCERWHDPAPARNFPE